MMKSLAGMFIPNGLRSKLTCVRQGRPLHASQRGVATKRYRYR